MPRMFLGVLVGWLGMTALAWGQTETVIPPGLLAPPVSLTELLPGSPLLPVVSDWWEPFPLYGSVDYLQWRVRPARVSVPLVATTRNRIDLGRGDPSLRNPDVAVLFGNQDIDYPAQYGFRVALGFAPTSWGGIGAETRGFYLSTRSRNFRFQSDDQGNPELVLPFFDTTRATGVEAGAPVAGLVSGRSIPGEVAIASSTELWSGEIGPTQRVWASENLVGDALVGLRLLGLREDLSIRARSVNGGESFQTFDRFETTNYFYGGFLGGRVGWLGDHLACDLTARVALGAVGQTLKGDGFTLRPDSIVRRRAGPQTVPGGFYSFSQMGMVKNTQFAVIPEIGMNLGYRITDGITLQAGYTFICWTGVLRAAEQVNRNVTRNQLPLFGGNFNTLPDPSRSLRESDFWAHGLNLGLDIQF